MLGCVDGGCQILRSLDGSICKLFWADGCSQIFMEIDLRQISLWRRRVEIAPSEFTPLLTTAQIQNGDNVDPVINNSMDGNGEVCGRTFKDKRALLMHLHKSQVG